MDMTKEIDEMAEKMVKANPDVVYAEVKRTIMELGVEGLRKAMPNLSEAHRELLKNVLLEMKTEVTVAKSHKEPIKNSSETLEPDINSTESGDYRQSEDEKPEFTEQDEKLVAIATKKKQDEPRNQGGVEIEGWSGQVIKSEELEKGRGPDKQQRKSRGKHAEKYDEAEKRLGMKKSEFVDTIKRMQERNLDKNQCVQALAKSLEVETSKIEAIWDSLAKAEKEKDDGDEKKENAIGKKLADAVDDAAEGEAEEAVDEHEEKMHAKEKIKKSEGEGSRGGKVIGHTSSGKPIYDNGHGHGIYNQEDHREAAYKLDYHATKERRAGLEALEQKHGKGNVPKEESKKLIMDNLKRYSDIIDMHRDAASSRNVIPSNKKIKKSDSYFFQEEEVYIAKSEANPFATRTVGKTGTYSVDAFIEAEETARKTSLAKSTFMDVEGEALIKACSMAKGEEGEDVEEVDNPADPKMEGKEVLKKKKPAKEEVKKSGEGSRGGKVIGHTSSGKPVYDNGHGHGIFNQGDHEEAARMVERHMDKEKASGHAALEAEHGKGNVPKEKSHDMVQSTIDKYGPIIDMHRDAASSRNIIPSNKKMKKSYNINDLIEKSLDMNRDSITQAKGNLASKPQVDFFVKSFDEADLMAELNPTDMWGAKK